MYDKLIKYITRGAFRQGNAAGGGCEAYEETLCNLPYDDRGGRRIDCAMTEQLPGVQEYYSTLDSLAAPSRVSGRVTAQLEMARPGIFEPQDAALGHESFSRNADADG